jgi:transcriptional regulator with GAF, ATPase, and Fis domain
MVMVFNRNKKRISSRNNGEGNMEMEEYQARIELLSEIAEEASSITEVSTLLERILKVTQHTLGTKVTTLFLNDETKSELHSPFSIRNYEGAPHRRAAAIELEVAKWVANNVKPILINNVGADSRFNKYSDSTVSTIVAAPILRGKKVIGVISSNDKEDGSDFTERDFEVIKGFASTEALILLVSIISAGWPWTRPCWTGTEARQRNWPLPRISRTPSDTPIHGAARNTRCWRPTASACRPKRSKPSSSARCCTTSVR